MASAAVRTWLEEASAFWSDKARDDAQALAALSACRSPLDVIVAEQNWVAARTSAYIDAGVRLLTGACKQAEQAAAWVAWTRLQDEAGEQGGDDAGAA